jgi:helicase-like protein
VLPGRNHDPVDVVVRWRPRLHLRGDVAQGRSPRPGRLNQHRFRQVSPAQRLAGVVVQPAQLGVRGPDEDAVDAVLVRPDEVGERAAGEGINLQCCHILFNYDIPWNPNRLEQRMGRIHRYGQPRDCLIFNFVATNTIEGHVLRRLLEKG